jgi:hypothetical protein
MGQGAILAHAAAPASRTMGQTPKKEGTEWSQTKERLWMLQAAEV